MTTSPLQITLVTTTKDIPFDLLALADPSKKLVNAYLKTGTCYVAQLNNQVLGVMVLSPINSTTMEIKNIAINTTQQGKGYGKALLKHAELISKKAGYTKLLIGTGNSSIHQLTLYQRVGFELVNVEYHFFLQHYPDPIIENGIQCKHKLILEKNIT